jgi:hypothetical protein
MEFLGSIEDFERNCMPTTARNAEKNAVMENVIHNNISIMVNKLQLSGKLIQDLGLNKVYAY